MLKQHSLK